MHTCPWQRETVCLVEVCRPLVMLVLGCASGWTLV